MHLLLSTWGSAVGTKMAALPLDRLRAEVEWIARNQIEFVYMGDSNWGMLPQDTLVADMLVEAKARWGYPKRVLANAPKNSSQKVFDLFDKLKTAGLQKAITLSMQSWNPETLTRIKRSNIKLKTYEELQERSKVTGTPTYSELILGLPGETLQSFCDGIDKNLDAGQWDGLLIYLCRVLPGSEMDAEEYRREHGLITKLLPIQANHGSLSAAEVGPPEYEETVIGTKTMPTTDWLEALRVAWFVETFFVLGIARYPLLWLGRRGVKVTEFARWAWWEMGRCSNGPSGLLYPLLGSEWFRVVGYLASLQGDGPDVPRDGIESFLPIRWPIEEASFLALSSQRPQVDSELRGLFASFVAKRWMSSHLADDLLLMTDAFHTNHEYLRHWTTETDERLRDPNTFAREVLWYGRRGGSMFRRADK